MKSAFRHIPTRVLASLLTLFSVCTSVSAFDGSETVYLQFPLVSRALYVADGAVKAGTYAEATGHLWTLVDDADGNNNTWKLKDGNGNYLTPTTDGNGVTVTTTESDATAFTLNEITYVSITQHRYEITYGSKYLQVSEDGSVTLSTSHDNTGQAGYPYSIARLSEDLNGPQLPPLGNTEYLYIYFPKWGGYLKDVTGGSNKVTVEKYNPDNASMYQWTIIKIDNSGYKIISRAGNELYLDYAGDPCMAERNKGGKHRLVEDADNTGTVCGLKKSSLWRIRRRVTASGCAMHPAYSSEDPSKVWTYERTASDDDCYLSFETQASEQFYISFPLTGRRALHATESDGLTGKSYTGDNGIGFSWLLENSGTENEYRLRSPGTHQYIRLNATKDGFEMTSDVSQAVTFTRETNNTYLPYTTITPYALALSVDGTTKYLGCNDDGEIRVYNSKETRYTTLRIANDVVGPMMPEIARTGRPSTVKWYKMRYKHSDYWMQDQGADQNLVLTNRKGDITSILWKLTDTNDGSGDVYLESYLGHQPAGGKAGRSETFTASTTSRPMRLQMGGATGDINGTNWLDCWQIRPQDDTHYIGGFLNDPYWNGDGIMRGFDFDWAATALQFEEATDILPNVFSENTASGTEIRLKFNGVTPTKKLKVKDGAVTVEEEGTVWFFIGTDEGFKVVSADGKYLKINGTAITLTTNAGEATSFMLQPNNSVTKDRIVWSLALKDNPDKALSLTPDHTSLTVDNAGETLASIDFDITGEKTLLQFSANGRCLLSIDGENSVKIRHVAVGEELTDIYSWEKIGTDDNFVLKGSNGKFLGESENGKIILTDDINAVHLSQVESNFSLLKNNFPETMNGRYDFCKTNEPDLRIAIINEKTGELGWRTEGGTRYSTIYPCTELNGPETMPASEPFGGDRTAPTKWYKVHFRYNDHYLTTAQVGESYQVTNAAENTDIQKQSWRFLRVLSANGTDLGEYYLQDYYGHYLYYVNGLYRLTDDINKAARMRLVEDLKNTNYVDGTSTPKYTLWRLKRTDSYISNAMHQPFGGGGSPDIGEYGADAGGNYLSIEECYPVTHTIICPNPDDITETENVTAIRFCTAGTMGLYHDAANHSVLAKNRTDDSENFRWGLCGTAQSLYITTPDKSACLKWDGTGMTVTAEAAEATRFSLRQSEYETLPERWDICSADGSLILTVDPATGTLAMKEYTGSSLFSTVNFVSDITAKSRELIDTDNYLRIFFAESGHRLGTKPHATAIRSYSPEMNDNLFNLWRLVPRDAARGIYYLRNGNGQFLCGDSFTSDIAAADIVHLVEGTDEEYWQLYITPTRTVYESDAENFKVGIYYYDSADHTMTAQRTANVRIETLSEEELNTTVKPALSSERDGNFWFFIQQDDLHDAEGRILTVQDYGDMTPAGGEGQRNRFAQIWRLLRTDDMDDDEFLIQSNSGNYLHREVTTDESGNEVVRYITTSQAEETTKFTFTGTYNETTRRIHWQLKALGMDGTPVDKIIYMTEDGTINEGIGGETVGGRLLLNPAPWYIDRHKHRVLHKRNGIYERQNVSADVTGLDKDGLQSTNEYEIVRCVKKGEDIVLESPTYKGNAYEQKNYQRWFDHTTYSVPTNSVLSIDQYWLGNKQIYAYENGLVLGDVLTEGHSHAQGRFFMPANAGETIHDGKVTVPTKYEISFEMSRYTDATGFDNPDIDPTEASLQLRCNFHIYEGQTIADYLLDFPADGDKAASDIAITFPTEVHGTAGYDNNYHYKYEVVPLDMRADSYYCWNEDNTDYFAPGLIIEMEDPDNLGIQLHKNTISGTERLIEFTYPNQGKLVDAGGKQVTFKVYTNPESTDNGKKAGKYLVAKYVITFHDDIDAMLFKDIIGNKTIPRSPEYLNKLYGEPVAKLTFDDDKTTFKRPDTGAEEQNTCGFPLAWDEVSYAYFPVKKNINSSADQAAWGEYALVRQFQHGFGNNDKDPIFFDMAATYSNYYKNLYDNAEDKSLYEEDYLTYHGESGKSGAMIYIDSSEKPGEIASLVFDGDLCPGSKMYFSAWLASGNENSTASPASVIFDLMGMKEDGSETIIYSYCPGQIMGRYYYHDTGTTWIPEQHKEYDGGWQQVFFSFSDTSGARYTKYLLRVRNNCMNSAGGDILIDNIKVYISRPDVKVTQTAPVCGTAINYLTVEANFHSLISSMGDLEGTGRQKSVWYCFLDKQLFDENYGGNPANTETAFKKALLGDPGSSVYGVGAYHRAYFNSTYTNNPEYKFTGADGVSGIRTYRKVVDGQEYIVFVDAIRDTKMEPGKEYYIVLVPDPGWNLQDFTQIGYTMLSPTGTCSVNSTFTTRNAFSVKINNDNESRDGNFGICEGASTSLRTDLVGIDMDGNEVTRCFYHDWWLDYLKDAGNFQDQKTTLTDGTEVYLSEVLAGFRAFNPQAETLDNVRFGTNYEYSFTPDMLDYLRKFVYPASDETPARLLLYRNTVTVNIPTDMTESHVTVLPIQPPADETTGTIFCYEPIQLTITLSGKAPQAKIGLKGQVYPAAVDEVPLRLGLNQILNLSGAADEDITDKPALELPFYIVNFAYPNANRITYSDRYEVGSNSYGRIRLAGSNDPTYNFRNTKPNEDDNLYIIGKVLDFTVNQGQKDGTAYIRFNDDFQPREGYYYTLRLEYEEIYAAGQEPQGDLCAGAVTSTLKVVPEYAVWTGQKNGDWTNDANWHRADLSDLNPGGKNLEDNNPLKSYVTNADNGHNTAYVPMAFTSVLLPEEAPTSAWLYDVMQTTPGFIQTLKTDATPYIQYDMMLESPTETGPRNYLCDFFRTQICNGITLKAGSELVRSDLLVYNKAWMEYRLQRNRWYTLGTPFELTYAGDWYVPTATGRQDSPYFQDIRYDYDRGTNHRYKPAVYQRSWDKNTARLYLLPGSATIDTDKKYEDVAVLADWSGVFNDVQKVYDFNGFSLKVVTDRDDYDEVTFRIPTEDTFYKYQEPTTGSYDNLSQEIDRNNGATHRFVTDFSEIRTQLTNAETDNPYYLVTNPFTCGMSLNAFFQANTNLNKKYWIVTANGQQTAIKDETNWTTADGTESDIILAPGQGFFVKVNTPGSWHINFDPVKMMTSAKANGSTLRIKKSQQIHNTLRVTAEYNGLTTTAIVREGENTSAEFVDSEDLECFIDLTMTGLPYVYTMAGRQAASINRLPALQCVPLGVQGVADGKEVTLTFNGCEGFVQPLYLYDNLTKERTPLTEQYTLRIDSNSHGRYYIVADIAPEAEEMLHEPTISIDGHTVTITSPDAVGNVRTYDMGGRLLYHNSNVTDHTHSFQLTPGVYTVTLRGKHNFTSKIVVN